MTDFGSQCELLAGMLSMMPARYAREFSAAEPITSQWAAVDVEANRSLEVPNPEHDPVMPRDLSRPVRFSVLCDLTEHDGGPVVRNAVCCYAVRQATRFDLRGARRMPFLSSQPALAMTFGVMEQLHPSRSMAHGLLGWHDREKRWIRWDCGPHVFNKDDVIHRQTSYCLALQFSSRYWWRVLLGYGNAARVCLCTNPAEARKLFATRDLPAGATRRAALRHWVTEHYRPTSTGVAVPVRSHFRGADSFTWDALACDIIPSEYDRDRVGQLPAAAGTADP
ncbi:MAG TPA: hypothetical protein VFN67_36375 [Polyangiales bacterium]|nr:hypothetical protein [Polyangiales bacterium]